MKHITTYNRGLKKLSDREWILLKKQAKELGINQKEIRTFLQKNDFDQL